MDKKGLLGFGLMRLPEKEGRIDIDETSRMVDLFLSSGFTYFDTAYAYGDGASEIAARDALVRRYPRSSYTLATKLCSLDTPEKMRDELRISLERTEAGYIDYYLLHAIRRNNIEPFDNAGIWDFVKEAKEKGLIRHYGFSYHDDPCYLDEMLALHPDVDFVQLQINYADWENPRVESRGCYEVARRHGKPVVIMEPVKGGTLANPPDEAKELFLSSDKEASFPSWALRFCGSLEGVLAILSGMSNMAQMEDNCRVMKDFRPLSSEERAVLRKVQALYSKSKEIPCTGCRYCTGGCPKGIDIPAIFRARNLALGEGAIQEALLSYHKATEGKGLASSCIHCAQCERKCPQGLPIISLLTECMGFFETK